MDAGVYGFTAATQEVFGRFGKGALSILEQAQPCLTCYERQGNGLRSGITGGYLGQMVSSGREGDKAQIRHQATGLRPFLRGTASPVCQNVRRTCIHPSRARPRLVAFSSGSTSHRSFSTPLFFGSTLLCARIALYLRFGQSGHPDHAQPTYSVIGQARNAYKPRHGPIETISLAASQNEQRHRFHCIELGTHMVSPRNPFWVPVTIGGTLWFRPKPVHGFEQKLIIIALQHDQ